MEPIGAQSVDVTAPARGPESQRFPVRVPTAEPLGFKVVFDNDEY